MEKLLVNTRKKRVLTLLITDIKVKKDLARTHKRRIRLLSFTQHSHYLSKTLSLSGEITRVVLIVVTFQIMTKIIQYSASNALSNYINGVNREDAVKLSWMTMGTCWSTISKRISSPMWI